MAPVLENKSILWRPQTDYERWLAGNNENYQPAEDAVYHPSIPSVNDLAPVFQRVINDSPRQRVSDAHPIPSSVSPLQTLQPHGEFIHKSDAGPKDALADFFRGHCPYQLVLIFIVAMLILQVAKSFQKQRCRANTSSPHGSIQHNNVYGDRKNEEQVAPIQR